MRGLKVTAICLVLAVVASAVALAANDKMGAQWWPKAPRARPSVVGTVTQVGPAGISVQTKDGVKPFVVTAKTRVRVRGEKATIAGVKVGDPVQVTARLTKDNVEVALAINVPKPTYRGKIASVEGSVIVLKNKDGELRVLTNEKTKFVSHGYQGTAADLRIGYGAGAVGVMNDKKEVLADVIQFVPGLAKGTVMAVDGNLITVKNVKQRVFQCQASPATAVLIRPRTAPNKKGTLADIKAGMACDIGFHPDKRAACPLLWIDLLIGE